MEQPRILRLLAEIPVAQYVLQRPNELFHAAQIADQNQRALRAFQKHFAQRVQIDFLRRIRWDYFFIIEHFC